MYTTTMTQPDPELFMNQFVSWEVAHKENKWQGRNITRWRNEEYDKTYRAAEGELDPVKRAAHVHQDERHGRSATRSSSRWSTGRAWRRSSSKLKAATLAAGTTTSGSSQLVPRRLR